MPLPLAALGTTFAGGIIAGLVQFFASRAGNVLAGIGLTMVSYTGFQALVGYIVGDINYVMSQVAGMGGTGGGTNLGLMALQMAAYLGLIDAINIIVSGYVGYISLAGFRFVWARLAKMP